MDELKLISEAKKGNKNALNTLLSQNYGILKSYMLKITGDINLAQDLTQETLLKAILNIKKFEPKAKFSTWLITIATNLYKDYLKKQRTTELIDEAIYSNERTPEELVITNIQYNEVKNILLSLPYEKRAVFILKHYHGYKYEEIAEILKCPIGTVRSRLHNCIKQIISEMERRKLI